MKICIFGASSAHIDVVYTSEVRELSSFLAKKGHSLVFGGGNSGIMGASARGFRDENAEVTGVAPRFFDIDGILFGDCTDLIFTDTMRERKAIMEDAADAFVIAPGGVGTFEEFFEVLTLKQLGRHGKPIAIFNTDGFYDDMIKFMDSAVSKKFIHGETLNLYSVCSTAEEVAEYIENADTSLADIIKLKYGPDEG